MLISKAVITAAGPGQTTLPLQRLVDRDGREKSALALIIDEVAAAGIEEVGIVIKPGDRDAYETAAGDQSERLRFIIQDDPRGYGDALLRAKSFINGESFLHLVGDHLYLSLSETRCAQQLIETATRERCAVSAVQPTRETMLPYFGTVGVRRLQLHQHLYEVKRVIEKPTPTQAEQELTVSGFRSGTYLCFFGMHVLTPTVIEILNELLQKRQHGVTLSDALSELVGRERYLACEIQGNRYNIGMKYGLLTTQLALSLSGVDRDRVLTDLLELVAQQGNRQEVLQ